MKKTVRKQMIVVALSLLIVTGICGNGTNEIKASNSLTNKTAITKIAKAKKKTRKPITVKHYQTVKKGKTFFVGIDYLGFCPDTYKWKSSNPKVATVTKREYGSGDHKVHAKRKGKATISCVVKRTYGHWVKGDVHKWVITVK